MGTRVNGVDLSDGAALSDATPAALGVASAGVSTEASRADHVHDRELPDPRGAHDGQVPTTTDGEYVLAGALALSDATPAALGVAAAGVSTDASRADHVHALPTIPAVSSATPQPIGTATAGVSADAARADHVHGLTSALISAPSTGWTAAGDGIASITAGEVTLTIAAAQNTALLAFPVDISSPFHPAIEVSARVTRTTTPGGGPLQRLGIGVGNALRTDVAATARGLLNEVDPAATVSFIANSAGSWGSLGTAALPATVDSGNLWLRIVYSAGGVSAFVGSGATRPTSWTLIAAAAPQHAISGVGAATHVQVYAYRNLGTGDMVVRVDQIQWRSLLGVPT